MVQLQQSQSEQPPSLQPKPASVEQHGLGSDTPFFRNSVRDSTDSLLATLQGGQNNGNFTINAKSIRIVNKNYFNDSNGLQHP